MIQHNFYIITGGPGAGKTTLLQALQQRNYRCIPEAARQIIQQQEASDGDALPWKNTRKYAELMLAYSIQDYMTLKNTTQICFFDRGIPDTLAYMQLINSTLTAEQRETTQQFRYNPHVFILPPWKEIYHKDQERKQSYKLAVHTYNEIRNTYGNLGYDLYEIPQLSVEQRADYIIKFISSQHFG